MLLFLTFSVLVAKRVDGTITTAVYYYKPILLCSENVFVLFLSGVPACRLIM